MKTLDFEKSGGLIPAIIQDANSREVLMLGYMSQESLQKTEEDGVVCFFSRSKNRLWVKGETSGNYLKVKEIIADCDADSLLILAEPSGPVCHTGADTCFDRTNENKQLFFESLEMIIEERSLSKDEQSYTRKLLARGIDRVVQKVGEEAVELVIAAKNDDADKLIGETADLFYHVLVLLHAKKLSLKDISNELERRHRNKN
jgi:phosphoribosyl-AMP cyclohydrolase / phosphoribosyl-ATP pyrophosphohydrolase